MKRSTWLKPVLLLASASLLATGCVYRRVVYTPPPPPVAGEVVVPAAPPPPVVESVTITPAPGYVWVAGAYSWEGRWVWEPGHWAHPPRPGAVWIIGGYAYRGGRHVWVRGYWR
ncbi:MAG TPA: hypothetical protein VH413_02190 [Verrucomicrobiae bacterium]|jgi:hypothetical protein|nr:hypothetical protein [Verrucomicrobiae bacterium]